MITALRTATGQRIRVMTRIAPSMATVGPGRGRPIRVGTAGRRRCVAGGPCRDPWPPGRDRGPAGPRGLAAAQKRGRDGKAAEEKGNGKIAPRAAPRSPPGGEVGPPGVDLAAAGPLAAGLRGLCHGLRRGAAASAAADASVRDAGRPADAQAGAGPPAPRR